MTKEISRRLRLSRNAEKHIRKHYKEFGFKKPVEFTRGEILLIARNIVDHCDDVFEEVSGDARIFFSQERILIVSGIKNSVRTMYVLNEKDYLERKIAQRKWIRIETDK